MATDDTTPIGVLRGRFLFKYGLNCTYCRKPYEAREDNRKRSVTVDHVLATTKGGTDDPGNLTLCCQQCNTEKNNLDIAVYLAARHSPREVPTFADVLDEPAENTSKFQATERLVLSFSTDQLRAIDDWRREQSPIPNLSAAIRTMVTNALDAAGIP